MKIVPVAILRKWQNSTGKSTPIGSNGVVFDAVFQEQHEAELEVCDNPVETGVTVSDHAYMKPLRVTISAGVSDSPLRTQTGGDPFGTGLAPSRVRRAFDILTAVQASAEPFDVQTGLKLYRNMVCTKLSATQDKDTGNVLVFEAELREVIQATTADVTYTRLKPGPTHRQASKKVNRGEQQAQQVTEPEADSIRKQLASILKKAL